MRIYGPDLTRFFLRPVKQRVVGRAGTLYALRQRFACTEFSEHALDFVFDLWQYLQPTWVREQDLNQSSRSTRSASDGYE